MAIIWRHKCTTLINYDSMVGCNIRDLLMTYLTVPLRVNVNYIVFWDLIVS